VSTSEPFSKRDALDRVLVVAPYRRDAKYLAGLLAEHEIDVALSDSETLPIRLREAAGVLITTHEALTPQVVADVSAHLEAQPTWSEMPIVVLLDRSSPNARVRAELASRWPRARLLFYERPVSAVELLSGVQSALLVRLRQRDVGDHIDREIELRRELNHRVKNILASVTSIFQMTRRGAATLQELSEDFHGRLLALSNVHSAVFQATGEAVSIREITDLTFAPYRGSGADRVRALGPDVRLTGENSTTLSLCLHELTTNAIKYGALSVPAGSVTFEWSLRDEMLTICWEESGGPPVVTPERSGYGTRFLRSALNSLFGQRPLIDFQPSGLRCEASGPARKILSNH
jgi:two-component sensor histidine kinase